MANKIEKIDPTKAYKSAQIKRMDIDEFRKSGLLRELNRRFLNPRGLALEVVVDSNPAVPTVFGGVWDYRDDPEGLFAENVDERAVCVIDAMAAVRLKARKATGLCNDEGQQVKDYVSKGGQ